MKRECVSEIVCMSHKNAQTKLARSQRQMHSCIQCIHHSVIHAFNPFIVMLAAPSLGKKSNKSAKFETAKALLPLLMST